MFGPLKTPFAQRIKRTAELVRAFAFLEDAGERQWTHHHGDDVPRTPEPVVPHPHRARLARQPLRRRPGMARPKPALCLTPIEPLPTGPMRRDLKASGRLQSHRAGPHHRS